MTEKILIAEDDPITQQLMVSLLIHKFGYEVVAVDNGKDAISELGKSPSQFGAILLDVEMPEMGGMETLSYIRSRYTDIPVIMLTADTKAQTAVEAVKLGAYDYMNKPFDPTHLQVVLQNAIRMRTMTDQLSRYKRKEDGKLSFNDMIGHDAGLNLAVKAGRKAATTMAPVLITGETGTGKELFARAIHGESSRAGSPFVAINCGAIPEHLIESTLFGHEKGAFTGAINKSIGKFREANGGTIFLDELGELPLEAQVKLLRVLQEQEVEPVGATKPEKIDVRVISATHQNIEQQVREGSFRQDLFFRLNVLPIHLPSLSERKEDIMLLAEYFLRQAAAEDMIPLKRLTSHAKGYLISHEWPGNIRELSNLMRRVCVWCEGETITIESLKSIHLDQLGMSPSAEIREFTTSDILISLKRPDGSTKTMEELEEEIMRSALQETGGNITHAADQLAIAKSTFYRKIKAFDTKSN